MHFFCLFVHGTEITNSGPQIEYIYLLHLILTFKSLTYLLRKLFQIVFLKQFIALNMCSTFSWLPAIFLFLSLRKYNFLNSKTPILQNW